MTVEHIRISKELEWVRPYLKLVKHLAKMDKLLYITAKRASLPRIQHILGVMIETTNFYHSGNEIDQGIVIYISSSKTTRLKPLERKLSSYSKLDILTCLAHELAHIDEPDFHTPQHKIDECKMALIFMRELAREGYISEEHELKKENPKYHK